MKANHRTPFTRNNISRRSFLSDVGKGMVAASVGAGVASELGFSTAYAKSEGDLGALKFGKLEPLVAAMQETPLERFQEMLVGKLAKGEASLKDLTAAGALANARTFGGEDYDGYHCMFALVPSLEMSAELPKNEQPLPVLKVLYRNTARIHAVRKNNWKDRLSKIEPAKLASGADAAQLLRKATQTKNKAEGDRILVALAERSAKEAFDALQLAVQQRPNVHGVALAHRAWEMVDLIGVEHAHTMLRQSVHFCSTKNSHWRGEEPQLHKVLGEWLGKLEGKSPGTRKLDDAAVLELARTIYGASRFEAAHAVAATLAEGISPEVVGEALSLAANEIVLRQTAQRTHGDSRGVHSSDAVNAWRNISRVTSERNQYASLIVAAYHVSGAGHKVIGGKAPLSVDKDPLAQFREGAKEAKPGKLLSEAEEAIRNNDQVQAASAVLRYSELAKSPPRPVFDLLLKYAVSEDGRLHAEKYYRTVTEEFASIRPAYRWRELVGLARVTASCYGMMRNDKPGGRAPGYLEARKLLKLG